jgi:hypothetical protein
MFTVLSCRQVDGVIPQRKRANSFESEKSALFWKKEQLTQIMLVLLKINEQILMEITIMQNKIGHMIRIIGKSNAGMCNLPPGDCRRILESLNYCAPIGLVRKVDDVDVRIQMMTAQINKIKKALARLSSEGSISPSESSIQSATENEMNDLGGVNKELLKGLRATLFVLEVNRGTNYRLSRLSLSVQKDLRKLYEPLKNQLLIRYTKALQEEAINYAEELLQESTEEPFSSQFIKNLGLKDEWIAAVQGSEKYPSTKRSMNVILNECKTGS